MVEKKLSQMILDKKLHGKLISSLTSFVKWSNGILLRTAHPIKVKLYNSRIESGSFTSLNSWESLDNMLDPYYHVTKNLHRTPPPHPPCHFSAETLRGIAPKSFRRAYLSDLHNYPIVIIQSGDNVRTREYSESSCNATMLRRKNF